MQSNPEILLTIFQFYSLYEYSNDDGKIVTMERKGKFFFVQHGKFEANISSLFKTRSMCVVRKEKNENWLNKPKRPSTRDIFVVVQSV